MCFRLHLDLHNARGIHFGRQAKAVPSVSYLTPHMRLYADAGGRPPSDGGRAAFCMYSGSVPPSRRMHFHCPSSHSSKKEEASAPHLLHRSLEEVCRVDTGNGSIRPEGRRVVVGPNDQPAAQPASVYFFYGSHVGKLHSPPLSYFSASASF